MSEDDGLEHTHLCDFLFSVYYVPAVLFVSHKKDYPCFIDAEAEA